MRGFDSGALAPSEEAWKDEAACRGLPEDWFFAEDGFRQRKAKAVCAECPVIEECREMAMAQTRRMAARRELSYDYGVFGGMSQDDRYAAFKREQSQ